jgi:subtilisin family serine protease
MLRGRVLRAFTLALAVGIAPLAAFGANSGAAAPNVQSNALNKIDPALIQAMDRDGKAGFIVVLREQADTSGAADLTTKLDKGNSVFQTLRAHADRTQKGLREYLKSQGVHFRPYYIANAIYVEAGRAVMSAVAARPEVDRVNLNYRFKAITTQVGSGPAKAAPNSVEWNIQQIRADQVWSQFGVTGQGTVVSEGDTGIQWDHPALKNAYRGWNGTNVDHNYNWWDATGRYPRVPDDGFGHGTHTSGTAVGYDPGMDLHIGVAYGAKLIHCKNMDDGGFGQDNWFLECFEWILAPWDLNQANPRPDLAPDVMNNSWRYGGGNIPTFQQAVQNLDRAGVVVEVSAGNEGSGCASLGSPSDYANVITTGATANRSETLVSFSSKGPSDLYPTWIKPDIVAPGENVNSSLPGSIYSGETWSGTSMAGPHVVGTVALLISANPALRGNVEALEQIIRDTANRVMPNPPNPDSCGGTTYNQVPNQIYGWGRLDALDAVTAAMQPMYSVAGRSIDAATQNPVGAHIEFRQGSVVVAMFESLPHVGSFRMSVANGTYDVVATAPGYQTIQKTVTINANRRVVLRFEQ